MKSLMTTADLASLSLTPHPQKKLFRHTKRYQKTIFIKTEKTVA
jgi:hypothetical protein